MKMLTLAALAMALALPAFAQSPTRPTAAPAASSRPATAQSALVDINSASESELDALPGVGAVRAQAIIKNRPYTGKDDLLSRHILPKNIYDGIKGKIIARQK